jgi:plastocyanin
MRRRLAVAVLLALTTLFAARAGVRAQARPGPVEAMVTDDKGKPIEDAVVSLMSLGTPPAAPLATAAIMDQHDKEFVPYMLPVYVGTRVTFPNRDNIRHHVYCSRPPRRSSCRSTSARRPRRSSSISRASSRSAATSTTGCSRTSTS